MTDERTYGRWAALGLPDLPLGALVAFDVETSETHPDDGGEVTSIAVAWHESNGEAVGLAFNVQQSDLFSDIGEQPKIDLDDWFAILEWLSRYQLVNHNIKFDLHMMAAGVPCRGFPGRDLSGYVAWDTMLAEWVLDPGKRLDLDAVTRRRLPLEFHKQSDVISEWFRSHIGAMRRQKAKKSETGYYFVPFDVIEPYAIMDAIAALKIAELQIQESQTTHSHLAHFISEELELMKVLFSMERAGLGFDRDRARVASEILADRIISLSTTLPFRPTATAAAKWFYADATNPNIALPHCVSEKTERPSVKECCVRELIKAKVPYAQEWADYQSLTHAKSMWYDGYVDKCGLDGKLRTDFKQTGTVSFRFSSSRVNLQALPHGRHFETDRLFGGLPSPRDLFLPSRGYALWELDLSQAELRVGAVASGCKRMLEAIREGQDLHAVTAMNLFGANPDDPNWSYMRQIGKIANFSLLYGVGPVTFGKMVSNTLDVTLSLEECKEIVRNFKATYPEINRAYARAEFRAAQKGWVRLVDGRERWFPVWDRYYHKAWNALVQGSIAVNVKQAMRDIHAKHGDILRLQIHDSLVLELPESVAESMVEQIQKEWAEMATDMFKVPMKVDAKCWK